MQLFFHRLAGAWRAARRLVRAKAGERRTLRPGIEQLEKREVPSTAAGSLLSRVQSSSQAVITSVPQSDALALVRGPAWSPHANRAFVTAEAPQLIDRSYFNTPGTYASYVAYFHGVLKRWVAQGDQLGLRSDDDWYSYLGERLQGYFPQVKKYLQAAYPHQTTLTYQLLMSMNLAHGYYPYATTYGFNRTVYRTLHLKQGDCSEIADLLLVLCKSQGIAARELGQVYNYPTEQGAFISNHVVVYAAGLWLDSETNTAYALQFNQLLKIPPAARLSHLVENGRVFGFYNWYLQPQVRQQQLANGEDGGIIAFYYQYYFQGLGQGNTQLNYVRSH